MDKVGIRLGLIMFICLLTVGQAVFTYGGFTKSYWIMLAGRFIFGLGGESLFVGKSAIVTQWFKGGELQFAFGVNLSVARVGAFINGPLISHIAANGGGEPHVGLALLTGFFICCFSLCIVFVLCCIDAYAEKKDGVKVQLGEQDKFHCRDLKKFNNLPYWLVTFSCVITYMVMFVFLWNTAAMLQNKYGFSEQAAGTFYGIPYIMAACLAPPLGLLIDKIGKRTTFVLLSNVLVLIACVTTIFIPAANPGEAQYLIFVPLVLLGFGYSIYASALWGCIPYTVPPDVIGTAFGLTTSIQNIGLTLSPLIASFALAYGPGEAGEDSKNYDAMMVYFSILAVIGIAINLWLYLDDIQNRDRILDKCDKGTSLR